MRIVISQADKVLERFGNQLAALGDKAPVVLARALNHEGAKGFTQVKRVLVKQTGIKYGLVTRAVTVKKANRNRLQYEIEADGDETNLNLFGAVQRKTGVSARPWNTRRIFRHTFKVAKYGGRVFMRVGAASDATREKLGDAGIQGAGRFPIRKVFGPNIARELVKDESKTAFEKMTEGVVDRVGREIARELKG